jgi:hypothetical protein
MKYAGRAAIIKFKILNGIVTIIASYSLIEISIFCFSDSLQPFYKYAQYPIPFSYGPKY